MAGGFLQWPIWKPYEIYASIDYVYGWPALEEHDGFGGAQGALNAIEATGYAVYLWWILRKGTPAAEGRGVQIGGLKEWFAGGRQVQGSLASKAAILGFTMAVMTLSKTVLYCKYLSFSFRSLIKAIYSNATQDSVHAHSSALWE